MNLEQLKKKKKKPKLKPPNPLHCLSSDTTAIVFPVVFYHGERNDLTDNTDI